MKESKSVSALEVPKPESLEQREEPISARKEHLGVAPLTEQKAGDTMLIKDEEERSHLQTSEFKPVLPEVSEKEPERSGYSTVEPPKRFTVDEKWMMPPEARKTPEQRDRPHSQLLDPIYLQSGTPHQVERRLANIEEQVAKFRKLNEFDESRRPSQISQPEPV